MLISDKQHQANLQNARHSPGPTSPEGKAAVRFNALTWGLRARSLMLDDEDPADYRQLWDGLEAEWQPQTHTERCYLEQMSMSGRRLRAQPHAKPVYGRQACTSEESLSCWTASARNAPAVTVRRPSPSPLALRAAYRAAHVSKRRLL